MPLHENALLRPNPLGDYQDLLKRQVYAGRPTPGYKPIPTSTKEGIWNFSNSTTMADPGNGKFRIDNATVSLAANISISYITDGGTDATNAFKSLAIGDVVNVQDQGNSANWARFTIGPTGITNNTTWFQLPVTYVTGG